MRWQYLAFTLVACGGGDPLPSPSAAGGADSGTAGEQPRDDPDPSIGEEAWQRLRQLSPARLPAPPPDVSNSWADDEKAAELGRAIFFDPRFSGELLDGDNDGSVHALGRKGETGKVSCAGCHVAESGFSDTRTIRQEISLAAGWVLRRTPSLLDVAQSKLLNWDGRRDSFFSHAFGPLESAVEMNSSRLFAAHGVFSNHRARYELIFGSLPALDDTSRFPELAANEAGCRYLDRDNHCTTPMRGAPGDGAEFDQMTSEDQDAVTRVWVNIGKALGAYQRLLTCGPSRFDAWVAGDAKALSRAEQRGAELFVNKARCVDCHSGPYLSDEAFHNVGLQPQLVATVFIDADDPGASVGLANMQADPLRSDGPYSDGSDGRTAVKIDASALGAFKTPRLRCVAERPAFMHTGHLRTLAETVAFFNRGGDTFGFPGTSELEPLNLSAREQADLVAFMAALSGAGPEKRLLTPP